MRRREFITLVGGAAVGWPLSAHAQQSLPVVGFLSNLTSDGGADVLQALRQGLAETGYVEGRNVVIESRWADDHNERLPALAADLIHREVAVIVAGGVSVTSAVKAITTSIPVVFNVGTDPVRSGFVASLNHPGGNLTGIANLNVALEPKRLEMLHQAVPTATAFGLLINPTNPVVETLTKEVEAAAHTLGVQLHVMPVRTDADIAASFTTLKERGAGGLVIGNDGLFIGRREQLGALSARQRLPTVFQFREFAAAGGLMSYGGSITDPYRVVGTYVSRILKGEKPADLPVQQSTKIDLYINLKTASALGITFPLTLLGRADEVIE
jgi:putative ABC transport system substrate-binding protein